MFLFYGVYQNIGKDAYENEEETTFSKESKYFL